MNYLELFANASVKLMNFLMGEETPMREILAREINDVDCRESQMADLDELNRRLAELTELNMAYANGAGDETAQIFSDAVDRFVEDYRGKGE